MIIQTVNFNPIDDPKLLCTCGHPKCDRRSVKQSHLNRVQVARTKIMIPMKVTSGGRCEYHPDEINKKSTGDHPKGLGMDVACTGATRGNIVGAGIEAGCNAIGVANFFVHLGYRPDLPEDHVTMWTYS